MCVVVLKLAIFNSVTNENLPNHCLTFHSERLYDDYIKKIKLR